MKQSTPITIIETVYNVKFTSNMIVVTAPGTLSFIIKYADAGCPPVADGVIAEK